MLLWLVAGVSALLAILAIARARRLSRRLDALQQHYWELRYDYTELRARVGRLDAGEPPREAPGPPPQASFVPLSTLKKN